MKAGFLRGRILCGGMLLATWTAGCAGHHPDATIPQEWGDRTTEVDLYWPKASGPAPLVVVAHGFARSRHRMGGWGEVLAGRGYAVAVPTLPTLAAHHDNAAALVALVRQLRAEHPDRIHPDALVLVGFSAGGLATARAAVQLDGLRLWVGLDPVDAGGSAVAAARISGHPGLVLFAEPHGCNAQGNGRTVRDAWAGPVWSARVSGATHCDPERPSNASCAVFCGAPDPERSDAFVDMVVDGIDAVVRCDAEALARIDLAGSDRRISGRVDTGFVASVRKSCPNTR